MAKDREILQVNLRREENQTSRSYGLYFTEVEYKGCLSTRALAEHIASHGSIWTRDLVEGVLKQLQVCIPEKVCQGYGVQLDGIGTFYPTIKAVAGGVVNAAAFTSVNDLVDGVRIRFMPELKQLDRKTAAAFKDHCSLQAHDVVRTIYEGEGNNRHKVKTLHKPISEWINEGCPLLEDSSAEPTEP